MAKAEIYAGACGYNTTVVARMEGSLCKLEVQSECKAILKMAEELTEVQPFKEISARKALPRTLEAGIKYCTHAACPVPVGIIKAVEIASGLNLPVDPVIKLSK